MSGVGPRSANTYTVAPPSNYVAGVGRGAMGFTTRSDIGPARPAPPLGGAPTLGGAPDPFGPAPAGYVAGRGRGMGDLARGQDELTTKHVQQDNDRGDYSESNYDEFSGYGEKLFTTSNYEEDDAEADKIYDTVDEIMDSRRKRSREQQMLLEKKRAKSVRIADQFADLKEQMANVTTAEWESIPEVGDHSLRLTQSRKKESFMPVPDSLIEAAQRATTGGAQMVQSVDPNSIEASGMLTAFGGSGSGRGNALLSKLNSLGDSVSGQTVVDPKGYLTNLNSIKVNSMAEVSDIQRARILLQSAITTNPKRGPAWIAAARLEEFANKMPAARKLILEGCENCPESEDVWLEAARLHPPNTAKSILANAVIHLPTSVKIWLAAADLEVLESRKKAILRLSLEKVPNAVHLWKAAIELENVTDARIMLARAVECVPHSVEMWLALAKLETHENARKVLNQARQAVPTERATWITAAKLEEANHNAHLVPRIIEKMVISLAQYQVITDRDAWIAEAEECEHTGAVVTAAAIVRNTIAIGVEAEDQIGTWMDDAEGCLSHDPPGIETARAILSYALEKYPQKKRLWQQAAMLEKDHGTAATLEAKLREGVKHCPKAEILWLMLAKEKWLGGDVPGAREILKNAFATNSQSQQIWLAAVKLEWENDEFERARLLLLKAREGAPSERVWLKSALLEREVGRPQEALKLLEEAMKRYPAFSKFYLMAGQVLDEELKEVVKARNVYLAGIQATPECVPLWRSLIRLEERVKGVIRARPTGEQARLRLPGNDLIWLECIRLERRAGHEKLAESLMAKALRECPKSGALWAEELLTCAKPLQKSRSIDALKACVDDPLVLVAVARLFERGGSIQKARRRFDRALALNPKLGDGWAYYYAMEYVQAYKSELIKSGMLGRAGPASGSVNGVVNGQSGAVSAGAASAAVTASGKALSTKDMIQMFGGIDSVDDNEEDEQTVEERTTTAATGAAAGVSGTTSSVGASTSNSNNSSQNNSQRITSEGSDNGPAPTSERPPGYLLDLIAAHVQNAESNQGELWCATHKETKLRRLTPVQVLPVVVERILGYAPALHTITLPPVVKK